MTDNSQFGVTRRSVARGAAWAVPAIAVSAAAPAMATSANTARFQVQWGPDELTAWQGSRTFTATNMDGLCPGTSYQVTITSAMLDGTPTSRNFTVARHGLQGVDACHRNVYDSFNYLISNTPVLVLSQTGFLQDGSFGTAGCNVAGDDSPRQQLNITVKNAAGATVATSNALFKVMDISSATGTSFGGTHYWDSVSFPNSPDTTVNAVATNDPTGNTVSQLSSTSGVGPYRTIAASAASPSPSWTHNFRMASGVPTQFLYEQHNSMRGLQAIAISGIEFDGPCA